MKITKYGHACLLVEKDNEKLIIDPGTVSALPDNIKSVSGIFITHVHADHMDKNTIQKILSASPAAKIFAPQEVLNELEELKADKMPICNGICVSVGTLHVDIFGEDHAVIYKTVPCANVSLLIDGSLYYPGDSFLNPEVPVEILAVPAHAPWMKTSEAMDFIKALKPKKVFPTHNSLLSEFGTEVNSRWLKMACDESGSIFCELKHGDVLS